MQAINEYLSKIHQQQTSDMITLGKFIKALEKFDKDWSVEIQPFSLIPDGFHSYRGYYEDLSMDYEDNEDKSITVGELLEQAKECIGKTFCGWKGGDFTMSENTPLWVSHEGRCSGVAISEVTSPLNGYVYINTYLRED